MGICGRLVALLLPLRRQASVLLQEMAIVMLVRAQEDL